MTLGQQRNGRITVRLNLEGGLFPDQITKVKQAATAGEAYPLYWQNEYMYLPFFLGSQQVFSFPDEQRAKAFMQAVRHIMGD